MKLSIDKKYKDVYRRLRRRCRYHGVQIEIRRKEFVDSDGSIYHGTFEYEQKLISICTEMHGDWFFVLLHEVSHMDQWIQRREWFMECVETLDVMHKWMNNKKELDKKTIRKNIIDIIEFELDCERRVLKLIENIDPSYYEKYSQLANRYLYNLAYAYKNRIPLLDNSESHTLYPRKLKADARYYLTMPEHIETIITTNRLTA